MNTVFQVGDLVYPSVECDYPSFHRRHQAIGIITHISDLPTVSGAFPHKVLLLYRNPFAYDDRFGDFHRNLFPLSNKTSFDFLNNFYDKSKHAFVSGFLLELTQEYHLSSYMLTPRMMCLVQNVQRALLDMPYGFQRRPATIYTIKEQNAIQDMRSLKQKELAAKNYNRMTIKSLERLQNLFHQNNLSIISSPRLSL